MKKDLILIDTINKIESILNDLEYAGLDIGAKRESLKECSSMLVQSGGVLIDASKEEKLNHLDGILTSLIPLSHIVEIVRKIKFLKQADDSYKETKIKEAESLLTLLQTYKDNLSKLTKLKYDAYNVIYETIKMEIKLSLNSTLLNTILSDEDATLSINPFIVSDIEYLKSSTFIESQEAFNRLLTAVSKQKLHSLTPSLVTKEIITLIVYCNNSKLSSLAKKEIKLIMEKLSENQKYCEIPKEVEGYHVSKILLENLRKLRENIQEQTSISKKAKLKMIAFLLSTTIFGTVAVNIPFLSRKFNTHEYFNTTKETIELFDGVYSTKIDNYYGKKLTEKELSQKLIVYEQLDRIYRDYKVYNLRNVIKNTVEEYLNIDINSPGVERNYMSDSSKDYESEDSKYIDNTGCYRELIRTTQDINDNYTTFNEIGYQVILTLLYIVLCLMGFLPNCPINSIKKLIKLKNTESVTLEKINNTFSEIENYLQISLKKISENEELKERFNEIISNGLLETDEKRLIAKIKSQIETFDTNKEEITKANSLVLELKKEFKGE